MERNKIKERRKSRRYPSNLKGQYFLKERKGDGKECTIINISLNGASLAFYTLENISVSSTLLLEIFDCKGKESTNVEGIVRWVKQGKKDFICGIELTETLDEAKLTTLVS